MDQEPVQTTDPRTSRRDFIRRSSLLVAGGATVGGLSVARCAHADGSELIKIGLVGCGRRGTGAAGQAMNTEGPTRLVAMSDVFGDRLMGSLRGLSSRHGEKVDVPRDRQFVGFDGYQRVLEQDIDLVILATPPGFRPLYFDAAVKAGKHVFMEKPVAVDAPGVHKVLLAAKDAKRKNLAVGVGLQRRHEPRYQETIKRLRDGAIGDLLLMRAFWNGAGVWVRGRMDGQTEMEYQMQNWYYFNWICGDHIVEQHVHNLDVVNWLKDAYPVSAQGQGGREVRNGMDRGQIYDHHFVEFTYADGSKLFSQCRHIPGCWNSVSEHVQGTKGHATIGGGPIIQGKSLKITDKRKRKGKGNKKPPPWRYGKGGGDGHQQEHHDLFADLRAGRRPNEAEYGALSTMTAIFGRMATYSGKLILWDDALNSQISLAPVETYTSFQDAPPVLPSEAGQYPVPVPGITVTV